MPTLSKLIFTRLRAFKYAFEGIKNGLIKEAPLKIHFFALAVLIAAGTGLHISTFDWVLLLLCSTLVIVAEILNTAIECICNLITKKILPEIKYIKDLGAAAVLISALMAIIIAILLGWKYIN